MAMALTRGDRILRLSSFRDAITLSAEWREPDYADGLVRNFTDEVVRLMLLVLEG